MKDATVVSYAVTQRYIQDYQAKLGADNFKILSGWVRSRSLSHLASCTSLLPNALSSRETMRTLMQVEAFFKKNSAFSTPECQTAAKLSFERGERICRITNRRLDYYFDKRDRLDPDLAKQWSCMERWISTVLGPYRTFLDDMPRLVRVTAGATSTSSRRLSQPYTKISKRPVCTPGAVPYLAALSEFFGYGRIGAKTRQWNRVETVPKNWKTDRTIACEPAGNIPLQLAFDTYAKRRLRTSRFRIDLSDQSRNQQMAHEASTTGSHATIDLSMASDTLAYNAVAALLPEDWFQYLASVRSPFGRMGNKYVKYAKFSSMGNGATFALETLVFAAACVAVGAKDFSVYGDDIVIETELYPPLLRLLRFFGFVVNQDKSHFIGPFRESCGVNAYEGKDITPFYIRDISRLKAAWCHNVNGLASVALPGGRLESYLADLVHELELPLVPFNEDSMSGVFIDVHSAYSEGLLYSHKPGKGRTPTYQAVGYRGYKAKVGRRKVCDSRSLFLWHLDAFKRKDGSRDVWDSYSWRKEQITHAPSPSKRLPHIRESIERSWVPTSSHKYVRKWVYWIPPVVGTPSNLYGWTDLLLSRKR